MFKNVASQKIALFAYDATTGAPKTGDSANITPYVSKDYGAVTVLGTATATEMDATNAKGWYSFVLTQAETNGDALLFSGKSSTANIFLVGQLIYSDPPNYSAFSLNASGQVDVIKLNGTSQTARDIGASVITASGTITNVTGSVGSVAGITSSDVGAIKTKTDQITFTVANQVDSNVTAWKGVTAPANTGDAFARLGVPTGASTAVDIAAIKSVLPAALVGGRIDASVGAVAAGAIAAVSFAANALDAVWSTAVRVLTAGTNIALAKGTGLTGLNDLAGSDVRAAVGMGSANLDTQLNTISLQIPSANTVADALLDRTDGIETSFSLRASMRLMLSAFVGRISGGGTTAETVRDINNAKNRIVYTVDANGNRTNVAVDVS